MPAVSSPSPASRLRRRTRPPSPRHQRGPRLIRDGVRCIFPPAEDVPVGPPAVEAVEAVLITNNWCSTGTALAARCPRRCPPACRSCELPTTVLDVGGDAVAAHPTGRRRPRRRGRRPPGVARVEYRTVSVPAPPLIVSAPRRPSMRSAPSPPSSASDRVLPVKTSLPDPTRGFRRHGRDGRCRCRPPSSSRAAGASRGTRPRRCPGARTPCPAKSCAASSLTKVAPKSVLDADLVGLIGRRAQNDA
jgi:hypothetical protein